MINMGVAVHLLPVTGVTLPFISMGGSSIWFNSMALGIILSVSRYIEEIKNEEVEEAFIPNVIETN
jgi:cell division protein FtsW